MNWQININSKTAILETRDLRKKVSFFMVGKMKKDKRYFEVVLKNKDLTFSQVNSFHEQFKYLFIEKVKLVDVEAENDIMYHIEDDIFISKSGEIHIFNGEFYNTNFRTALIEINENIPVNLIKTTIFNFSKFTYKNCEIDTLKQTIDNVPYFIEEFDDYDVLSFNKSSIIIYDDKKTYYENYENDKDLLVLKILEDSLFFNIVDYITFDEFLKNKA